MSFRLEIEDDDNEDVTFSFDQVPIGGKYYYPRNAGTIDMIPISTQYEFGIDPSINVEDELETTDIDYGIIYDDVNDQNRTEMYTSDPLYYLGSDD